MAVGRDHAAYLRQLATGSSIQQRSDTEAAQMASQPGPIGARALHSDPVDWLEAGQPTRPRRLPRPCSRERLDAQDTAVGVQCRGNMGVQVPINAPPSPGACSLRWPLPSLPLSTVQGVARTSREGDRVEPAVGAAGRSPSRTGRASFQPQAQPTSTSTSSVRQPVRPDHGNR
jgi:hypothetical protein